MKISVNSGKPYLVSVMRRISLASRPTKVTDSESERGNRGMGMVVDWYTDCQSWICVTHKQCKNTWKKVSGGSRGGSLGSTEPPFLSFCAHASPASCARTSAIENVLDSGNPPFQNPRSATEWQWKKRSRRGVSEKSPVTLEYHKQAWKKKGLVNTTTSLTLPTF